MDLNRIALIGHVVRDPEQKTVAKGSSLTAFTIATNRVWTDPATKSKKEAVDFHPITAWGRIGDVAAQYLKKGNKVYIEGRLQHRTFEGQAGKRTTAEVIAENLILLTPKTAETDEG